MAGVQALPGKRFTSFGVDPTILFIVGIDTDDGPEHPLCEPDRNNLPIDEALVKSLSKYGNVHEVVVRKDSDGRPLVVLGRQRVRCMRVANELLAKAGQPLRLLRVRHERSDDLTAVGRAVTENSGRRDDTPMGKARKMKKMLDLGATAVECAVAFCVSTTAIRQWKKMLDLAPEVQAAVDLGVNAGGISSSAAMNLSVLKPAEQVSQLKEMKETASEGGEKITFNATKRVQQNASTKKASKKHKTAFAPPRKPILNKVAVIAADKKAPVKVSLSKDAAAMLNWVLGKAEAKSIPGLTEALEAIEKAKNSLSGAQETALGLVDAAVEGSVEAKDLNKKVVDALVKRGLVERFVHGDGFVHVRRVEGTGPDKSTQMEMDLPSAEEGSEGSDDSASEASEDDSLVITPEAVTDDEGAATA